MPGSLDNPIRGFDAEDFRDPGHPSEILRLIADGVTSLILHSDLPGEMIDREIVAARAYCMRELPDRIELFDMIYASRWRRIRSQWLLPGGLVTS